MAFLWSILLCIPSIFSICRSADQPDKAHEGNYEIHIWEVGVALLKGASNGFYTESPKFSIWDVALEERYHLRLYPNGEGLKQNGNVSLLLVSRNNFETRPKLEATLLNWDPLDNIKRISNFTYGRVIQMNGWTDFCQLETLLDPSEGFIFNNKIKFEVRFSTEPAPFTEPEDHETFLWPVGENMMNVPIGISSQSSKFYTHETKGELISWTLSLYPQGRGKSNATGSSNTRVCTEIELNTYGGTQDVGYLELFVENARQANIVRHWHYVTKEGIGSAWGCLIDRDVLKNPANGFVDEGETVFGLRIPNSYVQRQTKGKVEQKEATVTHTWNVGIHALDLTYGAMDGEDEIASESPKYVVSKGNKKEEWRLALFPNGFYNDKFVSLFLYYNGNHTTKPFVEIFIVNKDPRCNLRRWLYEEFPPGYSERHGIGQFIPKEYLLNPANGFVVDNMITFGVQLPTDPNHPPAEQLLVTKTWEIELKLLQSGANQLQSYQTYAYVGLESQKYEISFRNATETWRMQLYPGGDGSHNAGFVSMYLVYLDVNGPREPRGEVFILNKKPENKIRRWTFTAYQAYGDTHGWTRFIRYSDLINEKNGFIFGDKSKSIRVGFSIPADSEERMLEHCVSQQQPQLCEDDTAVPQCPRPEDLFCACVVGPADHASLTRILI